MSNSYFQFKQFRIEQDRCAMKVCTDACVFGGIIDPSKARHVLDIGTGTGLLSLMIAQRCNAMIQAIDIDENAAAQARANAAASPFYDRVSVHHTSVQDFAKTTAPKSFDLVFCNPPFFENCTRSQHQERRIARHTDTLSFADLMESIETLLSDDGRYYVHVPIEFEHSIAKQIKHVGLFIDERVTLRHSSKKPETRVIFGGTRYEAPLKQDVYSFRTDDNSAYAPRVAAMLEPYYLSVVPSSLI